nr:Dihydrofolate reductase [uncultured bacterium]
MTTSWYRTIPQYLALGATVVTDLDAALDIARQEAIPDDGLDRSEIWVIGGAQVFQEALPFASKAFVTKIQTSVDADTYAPDMDALVDAGLWEVADPGHWKRTQKDDSGIKRYRFVTYRKIG